MAYPFNASTCQQYVGQMVRVHTHDGQVHHGVVDGVTSSGMYLRPPSGQVAGQVVRDAMTADGQESLRATNVYYGYGYGFGFYNPARFFVPFLSILALSSLLWW